jgi:hypothetical protein
MERSQVPCWAMDQIGRAVEALLRGDGRLAETQQRWLDAMGSSRRRRRRRRREEPEKQEQQQERQEQQQQKQQSAQQPAQEPEPQAAKRAGQPPFMRRKRLAAGGYDSDGSSAAPRSDPRMQVCDSRVRCWHGAVCGRWPPERPGGVVAGGAARPRARHLPRARGALLVARRRGRSGGSRGLARGSGVGHVTLRPGTLDLEDRHASAAARGGGSRVHGLRVALASRRGILSGPHRRVRSEQKRFAPMKLRAPCRCSSMAWTTTSTDAPPPCSASSSTGLPRPRGSRRSRRARGLCVSARPTCPAPVRRTAAEAPRGRPIRRRGRTPPGPPRPSRPRPRLRRRRSRASNGPCPDASTSASRKIAAAGRGPRWRGVSGRPWPAGGSWWRAIR